MVVVIMGGRVLSQEFRPARSRRRIRKARNEALRHALLRPTDPDTVFWLVCDAVTRQGSQE